MVSDLRYGLRQFLREPLLLGVAVLSIAIGVGANSAVYSLVEAVVLKPFPFKDPERLVFLWASTDSRVRRGIAGPDLEDWRSQTRAFEDVAGFIIGGEVALQLAEPVTVQAVHVQPRLFSMLGVQPLLGRWLPERDQQPSVLISHRLWRTHFGGNRDLVGQSVAINGSLYVVAGVMPPDFFFPNFESQIWIPLEASWPRLRERGVPLLHAVGRLRAGFTIYEARQQLETVSVRLERGYPGTNKGVRAGLFPIYDVVLETYRDALWALYGATFLVLLMCCANVASLLVARVVAREKEMAIRAALGAKRSRVFRQVLTESFALCMFAGTLGLYLAYWLLRWFRESRQMEIPRIEYATLSEPILLYCLGLTVLTAGLFGVVPALQASRTNLIESLKMGGTTSSQSGRGRLRAAFVVIETALALILFVGTGLLASSFVRVASVKWGFTPEDTWLAEVKLPALATKSVAQQRVFTEAVLERIRNLPGVESASMAYGVPVKWTTWEITLLAVDGRRLEDEDAKVSRWVVGSGYFQTLGVPIQRGREFEEGDDAKPRVVVSEALAKLLWPGKDPIGKTLHILQPRKEILERLRKSPELNFSLGRDAHSWDEGVAWEVIGQVGNVRMFGLDAETPPALYIDYRQQFGPVRSTQKFIVRTSRGSPQIATLIRPIIQDVDEAAVIAEVVYMSALMTQAVGGGGSRKVLLMVSSAFSILAMILFVGGTYGLVSHNVRQKERDLAIRMALGARGIQILGLVLKEGLLPTTVGLLLGTAGALWGSRILSAHLYGVSTADPLTFLVSWLVILVVACLAAYPPARFAVKREALVVLRND